MRRFRPPVGAVFWISAAALAAVTGIVVAGFVTPSARERPACGPVRPVLVGGAGRSQPARCCDRAT